MQLPHCTPYSVSFIHIEYFSSSPLLLRGTPDTAQILCRSFTSKRYRQLRVKDLPKDPTWWLEWNSNLRPSRRKAPNLPLRHHAPHVWCKEVLLRNQLD